MKSLVVFSLSVACAAALAAQSALPPPFPRVNATRLFDSDRIAVWDIVWPAGQPTALHRHVYDQVGTYYAAGGRVITTPEGTTRTTVTEVGSLSTTRKGTTHIEEGNTNPPLRAVFIELKRDTASALAPALGPSEAPFPRGQARNVLDDDRVAVWDMDWQAGPQGLRFRPSRETVIVWLGEGTVRISPRTGDPVDAAVHAGTMRHVDRGAPVILEMASGSPRTMFFEVK